MMNHRDAAPEIEIDSSALAALRSSDAACSVSVASAAIPHSRKLQLTLLVFMLLGYGVLMFIGDTAQQKTASFTDDQFYTQGILREIAAIPAWVVAEPKPQRLKRQLTFNSMLDHLLRGRFDVDPEIVGSEGYLRNGRVYSYWGIWLALLRLPLWIFHCLDYDMTAWSCLAAACIAGFAKIRTVFLLRRHGSNNKLARSATNMMLAYVLLGGSVLGFLKPTIYQEVISWAAAFGAIFVYLSIKGLVSRQFSLRTLCWMALCAGLALLTRVSGGIGLILAFLFLLSVLVLQSDHAGAKHLIGLRVWKTRLLHSRLLLPVGILALCMAATGTVNYFRWGNPITFTNFTLYVGNNDFPDRVPREATYGLFNVRRIPFGLSYYFLPIWDLPARNGQLLFQPTQERLFDLVELPPSTFLLTDLLPLSLIALLAISLFRRRSASLPSPSQCIAIAAGLAAPCVLMLTAIAMSYRYRMEFYPELDFLAFLGLFLVLTDENVRATFFRFRAWMAFALVVSVAASFTVLILYDLARTGLAQDLFPHGLV